MPPSAPVLEARDLTLAWGEDPPVVEGLDLTVGEGETVCLVGKSGTGKTTILHALSGLLVPRRGRVLLGGENITGKPGRVSYMLQKDLLLPNLRIVDNACLPLVLAGMPRADARAQAMPLLERFGLADVAQRWPHELSGGMRQRVAFARTYLQGNRCILLDEPFSALDAITRADLRAWFRDMAGDLQLSTLMITHDADEAALLADRIYVLGHASGEGENGAHTSLPTRVVGEVVPARQAEGEGSSLQDYSLTPEFLAAKARILDVL